ncbi:hypothetical protein JCM10213_005728 [Rhodosporidiobolus nylandii]
MGSDLLQPFYTPSSVLTIDNWRDRAAAKRASRDALIPVEWRLPDPYLYDRRLGATKVPYECGILTTRELEITELDELEELASRLAQGIYTALEVTTAFCKRAAIAQQLTNCLTEIFFEDALARAAQLDASFRATGKPVGPLHGVPISLKDQFDVEGTELTMGYASYLGRISAQNSSLVELLLDAGAVVHCRTNVPMTLLDGDTDNHVFGRTHNPLNVTLSPGGSSGGEGALVAMKGSILGVGTDIGGSIRIPASFCGLYGLRPTSHRVPYGMSTNSLMGQHAVPSVAGPLARTVSSCTFFLRCVLESDPSKYDGTALPFPFDAVGAQRVAQLPKLAFGLIRVVGMARVHPSQERALLEAVEELKSAGHHVVEFDFSDFADVPPLLSALLHADGGDDVHSVTSHISEPLLPHLTLSPSTRRSVVDLWALHRRKEELQQSFLRQWRSTTSALTGRAVDALLLPTTAMTACRPGDMRWGAYGAVASLLDLPALALPFGTVDEEKDQVEEGWEALNAADEECRSTYDPAVSAGMPTSIQLIGRRYKDEELLAVAERVVQALSASSSS